MSAIYHPGVVAIVPHYNIGSGRDAVNVTYWQTAVTGLTLSMLTAIQVNFDSAWSAQWATFSSFDCHYLGSWVIDMSSDTGQQVTNSTYSPVAGHGTSPLGDQVAGLLSLHGATRYRGGHARLYIPGVDSAKTNNDGRTLEPAGMGILESMLSDAGSSLGSLAPTAGGPLTQIIWHKKKADAVNTIEPVLSFTGQQLLATQRRRLRKVSRHKRLVG